jgi:protein arginine N-methyltransferase 1
VILPLGEHRTYVGDATRIEAFTRALHQVIKRGQIVLDLGAGTGILSLLACSAGAGRVYAIDDGGIAGLARELVRRNGCAERVTVIREHSERLTLPELVDVVVCDQIGRMGVDVGMRQYMLDARNRLAKRDATLIPRTIETWFAPCEHPAVRHHIAFWESKPVGLSWDPVCEVVRSAAFSGRPTRDELLAAPARLSAVELLRDEGGPVRSHASFVVERPGMLDAIAVWFRAELADGVWITNGPVDDSIDRRMTLLPASPAIAVGIGDVITADLRIDTKMTGTTWQVGVASSDGHERHRLLRSTFESLLLSPEDLPRAQIAGPRLNRGGTLRKHVLQLCDGMRTREHIDAEMFEFNRDVFGSLADAARFVDQVLQQDAE